MQFAYAPSEAVGSVPTNIGNVVTNSNAVVFRNGDAMPGRPGNFILNCFRNQIMTDGSIATLALWGLNPALVATANVAGRDIIVKPASGAAVKVFGSGDVLDSATASTVFSDYDFSNNGVNKIFGALVTGATSTTDGRVFKMVGSTITVLAREGSATGGGDNWGFFNFPGTNNGGTTVWTGTTSNVNLNQRQALTIDGSIVVRGSDTLDNLALSTVTAGVTTATVARAAFITDNGFVAHIWGDAAKFALFVGNKDAILESRLILKNGDRIDTDGDYTADATIDTIEGGSTGGLMLGMSDNLTIALRARYTTDIDSIQKQGILSIPISLPADANRDGFRGFDDFDILSTSFNSSPGDSNWEADADFNFDGFVGFDDFDILSANFNS